MRAKQLAKNFIAETSDFMTVCNETRRRRRSSSSILSQNQHQQTAQNNTIKK